MSNCLACDHYKSCDDAISQEKCKGILKFKNAFLLLKALELDLGLKKVSACQIFIVIQLKTLKGPKHPSTERDDSNDD